MKKDLQWMKVLMSNKGNKSRKFNREFFTDIGIGSGIFGITLIPFWMRIPYIGSPIILLIGPLIGLLLSYSHRNPR